MKISSMNKNYPNYQIMNNTTSFQAMKKADFRGIDYAVVEKFKAPIEKFDALADFQNWAGGLVEKIKNTNFLGRQAETVAKRRSMLKDWFNYVIKENGAYTKAMQLLILSAITKNLGENDDNLPPTLNKGVLADCMSDLSKDLETDNKSRFDFNKMYQNKLRAFYMDDTKTGESETKWVVIPSKKHDSKNFKSNVEKLKTLSHKSWCTKTFNAEPYLSEGDFHVYLENGEPKIGIRFIGNKIQEIQGELNNSKIPYKYFNVVNEHVNKNNFKLEDFAKFEIADVEATKQKVEKIKQDLAEAIQKNDATKIYKYFGIKVEKIYETNETSIFEKIRKLFGLNNKKENSMLTKSEQSDQAYKLILSKYEQPDQSFTYKDLGIDENKLFKYVIKIEGDANFKDSSITDLANLKSIGGDASFCNSKITNLGKLQSIGSDADFRKSNIISLGNLQAIGRDANFEGTNITNLSELKFIGRDANFKSTLIDSSKYKPIAIGGEIYSDEHSNWWLSE